MKNEASRCYRKVHVRRQQITSLPMFANYGVISGGKKAGATNTSRLRDHQKAFPLIGMQDDQFIAAGQLMSRMQRKHRFEAKMRRRLTWDLLIALSAKENNALLITENNADFRNIRKWIDFEYMSVPVNAQ
jgi:predicted nucleic acid-binding protein